MVECLVYCFEHSMYCSSNGPRIFLNSQGSTSNVLEMLRKIGSGVHFGRSKYASNVRSGLKKYIYLFRFHLWKIILGH
jgi:hypothetical protein